MTISVSEIDDNTAHKRKVITKYLMYLVECFEFLYQKKIHTKEIQIHRIHFFN